MKQEENFINETNLDIIMRPKSSKRKSLKRVTVLINEKKGNTGTGL